MTIRQRLGRWYRRAERSGFDELPQRTRRLVDRARLKRTLRRRAAPLLRTVRELTVLMKHDQAYPHDDEVPMLARYAQGADHVIVEIGSAFGGSTALVLAHKRPGTVMHSIDPFVVDSMADFQAIERQCRENVALVLKAAGRLQALDEWCSTPITATTSSSTGVRTSTCCSSMAITGTTRCEGTSAAGFRRSAMVVSSHDSRKEPDTPPDTFNRGFTGLRQQATV